MDYAREKLNKQRRDKSITKKHQRRKIRSGRKQRVPKGETQ